MEKKLNIPRPVIACALFVFIFTNLFSFFIFNHIPRVHDEIDYLFQAKIFKSGRLYVPSPCAKEFFNFAHMINNGKWYSQYPPGYPFLLLLGLLMQAPWLINPLLAALSIILFYFLGKEIYDSQVGLLAAIFGSISIWFLLMSSTMMSHTSCMFFISLFLFFLFRSLKKPSTINGLLAGLGLGMALLIRPYTALLISVPFLLFYVSRLFKNFKIIRKNSIALILILTISVFILLIYNNITNNDFFTFGYEVCHGKEHGIGFGKTGYTDTPHTVFLGFTQIFDYIKALNKYLFGWPLSSFLAIFPLFFFTKTNFTYRKKDLVLASGFFSLLVGFFLYWGTHILIGARMIFEVIPILILLSARGATEIPKLICSRYKKIDIVNLKKILTVILIIFTAYAFLIRFPRWIWPKDTQWYYHGFANKFAAVTPNINQTLKSLHLEKALVIIKFIYHPVEFFPSGWWGSGFLYNDPQLNGNIIYVRDRGKENINLFQCFPERKFHLYFGTLEKGMLIPLKKEGKKISYGNPICFTKKGKKFIELVDDPKKFFKVYSTDYANFIEKIYNKNNFFDIDVAYLIDSGKLYKNERNYKKAALCFEAALQIEKQPEIRFQILNQLFACYLKTGKKYEAKIIAERMKDFTKQKFYNIIPEKGF